MEKKNGTFVFRSNLYNGQFIGYYYSGRKEEEGTFVKGKLNGHRKMYYQKDCVTMHDEAAIISIKKPPTYLFTQFDLQVSF